MDEVNWQDITIDPKYYNQNTSSFIIESNADPLTCNLNLFLQFNF
jgi:hypothetical protein